MKNLLIIGAGQYGTVAKETALSMNVFGKIEFIDDNSSKAIGKIADIRNFISEFHCAFIAIGKPEIRKQLFLDLNDIGFEIVSLFHSKSYVSPSATIGRGSMVEAMAIVNSNTTVGNGTFISAGAVVNHNCKIGSFCHIDVNSTIKSNSEILDCTKIEFDSCLE